MAVSIMDFLIGIVKDPKVIENSVVDGLGYRMTWIKMENGEKISVKYDRGISVSVLTISSCKNASPKRADILCRNSTNLLSMCSIQYLYRPITAMLKPRPKTPLRN